MSLTQSCQVYPAAAPSVVSPVSLRMISEKARVFPSDESKPVSMVVSRLDEDENAANGFEGGRGIFDES